MPHRKIKLTGDAVEHLDSFARKIHPMVGSPENRKFIKLHHLNTCR